jgi:hypothetical protein
MPGGTVYSGTPAGAPAYGAAAAPAYGVAAPAVAGPVPSDLHWALVFLFSMISCGLFNVVWLFIEAAFVKKIMPASKHLALYIAGTIVQFGSIIVFYAVIIGLAASSAARGSNEPPAAAIGIVAVLYWVGLLSAIVLYIIGNFKMRSAMLEYYNTVEPINLRLSGVMTFFFAILYFQYHLSRIAAWKKTGILVPQVYQG